MSNGKISGYSLSQSDIPVVLGMVARGDRNHDIAAWFGVNPGRIAEAKQGTFGSPPIAPSNKLPPSGAPGIKGRTLQVKAKNVMDILSDTNVSDADARAKALARIKDAIDKFNTNEI